MEVRAIFITDLLGKTIGEEKRRESASNAYRFDLTAFGKGIYLVHVKTANGMATKKVVVN